MSTRLFFVCAVTLVPLPFVGSACATSTDSGFSDPVPDLSPDGGGVGLGVDASTVVTPGGEDPATCDEAKAQRSYVGCDFWPTIVANNVWSLFDFAVVVANVGTASSDVVVTGPAGFRSSTSVPAGEAAKIYLPWVRSLKGNDWDKYTFGESPTDSTVVRSGAYHLTSSVPVMVYQFNALEYGPKGGPAGKDWTSCPGYELKTPECFSYSNDASLLAPSTALTSNVRVAGIYGGNRLGSPAVGGYVYITATQDNTEVSVALSKTSSVLSGGPIPKSGAGQTLSMTLQAGDVARVQAEWGPGVDLSGSLIHSTEGKPIQVISGITCIGLPTGKGACDHVEEAMFPAETLGKRYAVPRPTGPRGTAVGHIVRFVGNADGTRLTYLPSKPKGCPDTLEASQLGDCGVVEQDFEVSSDREFLVSTFLQGSSVVDLATDAGARLGDPSLSLAVAVEQFRSRYVFLAPDDYDRNYVDVVTVDGNSIWLDGVELASTGTTLGDGLSVLRVPLPNTKTGSHVLTGAKPFGAQVIGYGQQTSYHVPAGLNLGKIAPPPPPPK